MVFESNHGRKVIPFCPSVPVSIPASEALGRPFVQLKLRHFTEFYNFPSSSDGAAASSGAESTRPGNKRKRGARTPPKAVRELMWLLGEASSDSADQVFVREVELVKQRYVSLAEWAKELLDQKRASP